MQKTYIYLAKNKITIVADLDGTITEYRPVYQRTIQIYKGIDNIVHFDVKNHDQKNVDITAYTPKLLAFDENQNLILEKEGTKTSLKGEFTVNISENDLLNVKDQYFSYCVVLVKTADLTRVLTYSDDHFNANGIMQISGKALPGPQKTYSVTNFIQDGENEVWYTESIDAQPAINGNSALHTIAIYTDGYTGDFTIQGTLENQVNMNTVWADIITVSLDNEQEPVPVNFNGVYSFLRFKTDASPANTITKVLVRN